MEIAFLPAVIEPSGVLPPARVTRDPLSSRQRPKDWLAPNTIGRGSLIDLLV
ncbi:MAG TPA: hypothetical protein VKV32_19190 [Stellaceae bacterium]|nr:hypothetical protein [Stellaceae bacterium]